MIRQESRAFFRKLGAHITKLRKQCGMTQAELARALEVSQQTVFAYELGDRRVSVFMVVRLASILDTSVASLIGMTEPPRRRRLSPAGIRHAERYAQLSKTQQRFVSRIIETLLMQQSRQQMSGNIDRLAA